MNKFATIQFKTKTGFTRDIIVTSEQMAEVGLKMGWISPDTKYAKKLASTWKSSKSRRIFVKTSSRESTGKKIKLKFSAARWVDLGMANGWIKVGMNKKAGFWSGLGESAGAAWNAAKGVGRGLGEAAGATWNAAKGVGNAAVGAGKFVVNAAGQVVDAAGKAIQAGVNAAGQVVDATGRVLGTAVKETGKYVGQLANEAKAGFANTQEGGARAGTMNPLTGLAEAASPVTQPIANAMVAGYDGARNMAGKAYNAAGQAVDAAGKVIAQTIDAATMAAQVAQMSPAQLQRMQSYLSQMPAS